MNIYALINNSKTFILLFLIFCFFSFFIFYILIKQFRKRKLSGFKVFLFLIIYCLFSILIIYFILPDHLKNRILKRKRINSKSCTCNWNLINAEKYKNNYYSEHIPAAIKLSNNRYIVDEQEQNNLINKGYLVKVKEDEGFGISNLEYSTAVLLPIAKNRLIELGKRFRGKINTETERGSYFIISSITRTEIQQKQVEKIFPNAAARYKSSHSFGASFDIKGVNAIKNCDPAQNALKQVLIEMQQEGKILLCPEKNCIHITVKK